MIHVSRKLDGDRLEPLRLEGFPDEAVLLVPLGDMLMECGFRIMERPCHTAPTEPPRAATLDEIAETVDVLAERVRVQKAIYSSSYQPSTLNSQPK